MNLSPPSDTWRQTMTGRVAVNDTRKPLLSARKCIDCMRCGPTRDISPESTLNSCGNSSIELRRRSRPTRVTRGSFRVTTRRAVGSIVSLYIERNFSTLMMRSLYPCRFCLKRIGPPVSSQIAIAATSITGQTNNRDRVANTISKTRFIRRRFRAAMEPDPSTRAHSQRACRFGFERRSALR